MVYQFQFHSYQRPFKCPLKTRYGTWQAREGILLQLMNQAGQVGNGEIAPLPWFGSETLEQALAFCRQLPSHFTEDTVFAIPPTLPACQFGFEMALEQAEARNQGAGKRGQGQDIQEPLQDKPRTAPPGLLQSALLPAGESAIIAWKPLWQAGYRTFKWKIGVEAVETELAVLQRLAQELPMTARLRLDANGGLSLKVAKAWLTTCDRLCIIEYLEQPLPSGQFAEMMQLSVEYATALALDESVATLAHLQNCHEQGWRGIYVIKPAIAGSPRRLRHFFQTHPIDAIFSSVFETEIGREAGLKLAAELGNCDRAMGYGTNHWINA
jgi:O-succinylbenzoate synthase